MEYSTLSMSLRRKISVYNLVTDLYKDVSLAWEVVSCGGLSMRGIDSVAINKLANDQIVNRLIYFYKERVSISASILKQVSDEYGVTSYAIEDLSNAEKINRADKLIHDILPSYPDHVGFYKLKKGGIDVEFNT